MVIRSPINVRMNSQIKAQKALFRQQLAKNKAIGAVEIFDTLMHERYGNYWEVKHPKLHSKRFSLMGGRLTLEEALEAVKDYKA